MGTGRPFDRATQRPSAHAFTVFRGWPAEDIQVVRQLGDVELYSPGAVVVYADGSPGCAAFIVLSGRLAVDGSVEDAVGLTSFRAGDVVGAMSFIDGRPEPVAVRALEPSSVLRLRRDAIVTLATVQPVLALRIVFEIATVLADRLRGERTARPGVTGP